MIPFLKNAIFDEKSHEWNVLEHNWNGYASLDNEVKLNQVSNLGPSGLSCLES